MFFSYQTEECEAFTQKYCITRYIHCNDCITFIVLLTFDFVCCSGTNLRFHIFQQVSEGPHQILLGNLWTKRLFKLFDKIDYVF